MSKFETEDRGALGYFLTEDGELRLRKLHQHIEFLARLSEPRIGEQEDGPAIDTPSLSGYLELLAEQVQQVIDAVSWGARLEATGEPVAAEGEAEALEDADDDEADDAEDGDEDEDEDEDEDDDGEHVGTRVSAAAVDEDYPFGMTLDQVDDANRLLDLMAAQGDLLMASGDGDFADGTLVVLGSSIFDGAHAVHDIIRQVSRTQRLAGAGRRKVREMPPAYGNAGSGMASVH